RVRCESRQIVLLLRRLSPVQQRLIDERILHVGEQADGGIDRGERFHGQRRVKEGSTASAEFFGNADAHKAKLEELAQEAGVHLLFFIHAADERSNFILREPAHGLAEEQFFLAQFGDGARGVNAARGGAGDERISINGNHSVLKYYHK